MSANVIVYVKVLKAVTEIVEVSALTLDDAKDEAAALSGVICIQSAAYDKEDL